jgi:hypothetical protein
MKSLARSAAGYFGSFWLVFVYLRRSLRVKSLVLPPEVAASDAIGAAHASDVMHAAAAIGKSIAAAFPDGSKNGRRGGEIV